MPPPEIDDEAADRERLKALLRDRGWRLSHLYWITDKWGKVVRFVPNAVQELFLAGFHNRNIVLKSRQHGITTLAAILALDTAIFRRHTTCGLVMHKKEDADKVFSGKILFAYERLPDWLRQTVRIVRRDMNGELEFSNGSKIYVSLSHRSGTLQFLHVSEYGPMGAFYPLRAQEVKTGALNTLAPDSIVTIESTAHGRIGDYYQMCQRAMQLSKMVAAGTALLDEDGLQVPFFRLVAGPRERHRPDRRATGAGPRGLLHQAVGRGRHCAGAGAEGLVREEVRGAGRQDEAGTPLHAGGGVRAGDRRRVLRSRTGQADQQLRLCDLPIIPGVPVNTFWDIGMSDTTSIWFHQAVGPWHHFIDFYEMSGEQAEHYARVLLARGYVYGKHFLPHDGVNTDWSSTGNLTRAQVLQKLLPGTVELVERIDVKQDAIDMARQALARSRFDRVRCGENPPGSGRGGFPALQAYRKA
ncbi:DNA packaging protein, partial [Rhodanobacter lindaniclasticus]